MVFDELELAKGPFCTGNCDWQGQENSERNGEVWKELLKFLLHDLVQKRKGSESLLTKICSVYQLDLISSRSSSLSTSE